MAASAVQHKKLKQICTFPLQIGLTFVQGTYSLITYLIKKNIYIYIKQNASIRIYRVQKININKMVGICN